MNKCRAVYPMQMNREEDLLTGNWIHHPELVKEKIIKQLKIEYPDWEIIKIRLDPGLNHMFYKGKPILLTDELIFVDVLVPETENINSFVLHE